MATANDIITRARARLGIDASEEPLSAVEQLDSFNALKEMLSGWILDGVIKAFSAADYVSTVTIAIYDDSSLDAEQVELALVANLAIRLSDSYGITPTAITARDAIMGKDAIHRKHFLALEMATEYYPVEDALQNLPSQRHYFA